MTNVAKFSFTYANQYFIISLSLYVHKAGLKPHSFHFVPLSVLVDTLYDPDCTWCADVLDPHLILGMIIWLAVISIALIILIVTHCFRRCCSGPKAEYRNGMSDKTDLWKKYDNIGFDNGASKQAEEGRTEF